MDFNPDHEMRAAAKVVLRGGPRDGEFEVVSIRLDGQPPGYFTETERGPEETFILIYERGLRGSDGFYEYKLAHRLPKSKQELYSPELGFPDA